MIKKTFNPAILRLAHENCGVEFSKFTKERLERLQ